MQPDYVELVAIIHVLLRCFICIMFLSCHLFPAVFLAVLNPLLCRSILCLGAMGTELQGRVVDLHKDVEGENYEVGQKSDVPNFLSLPQISQFSHFPGNSPFLTMFPSRPPSFAGGMPFMQPPPFPTLQVVDLTGNNQSGFPHIRIIGYSKQK